MAAARTWRQSSLSATEWWVTRHRDEQELGAGRRSRLRNIWNCWSTAGAARLA
jgi:hypothetical protein